MTDSLPGLPTRIGYAIKSFLELVYPIFAAYAVITSFLPPLRQLSVFLSMTLILVFLKFPALPKSSQKTKPVSSILDGFLIFLSILIVELIVLAIHYAVETYEFKAFFLLLILVTGFAMGVFIAEGLLQRRRTRLSFRTEQA